ncbi:septum formation initiator family protein [Roseomonas sp. NAR14]|uniref:Septum formation initiator family protein n=1 Tax=Roseomonas acroporae TaxID=2937791 RepID=A0A9X1Y5M5_9PROT|nr:septum formation initiator family protein [Roseomonas acroporae]MCK8783547.1 septum formation initiator family protein [Roseomonas acroporae]
MSLGRELKRRVREAALPMVFVGLSFYFGWHVVHGDRGLIAYERRMEEIRQARVELAQAEAERDALERRVNGLRANRLDRDQLDERARARLNLVGHDDIVIPYEAGRRLY